MRVTDKRVRRNSVAEPGERFALPADYEHCRRIHRHYGTSYYLASRLLPKETRIKVDALYGFVRVPDEWVDNPGTMTKAEQRAKLQEFRNEFLRGLDGVCPSNPVLRAFCDVARDCEIPLEEPLVFLEAMEADLDVRRYKTYSDLRGYMRGSAVAVGVMMCCILKTRLTARVLESATALGDAMQMTNFLRDIAEDAERGRVYMPREEMDRFGLREEDLLARRLTPEFVRFMRFQLERTRELYAKADEGIPYLSPSSQKAVRLSRVLYSRILDRIEDYSYNVFPQRIRVSTLEKVIFTLRVMIFNR